MVYAEAAAAAAAEAGSESDVAGVAGESGFWTDPTSRAYLSRSCASRSRYFCGFFKTAS